ncbi:MAG: hypothetical protein ACI4JE_07710 [Ruminococcus sp.]
MPIDKDDSRNPYVRADGIYDVSFICCYSWNQYETLLLSYSSAGEYKHFLYSAK